MIQRTFSRIVVFHGIVAATSEVLSSISSEDVALCDGEDRSSCADEASVSLLQNSLEVLKSSDPYMNQADPRYLAWLGMQDKAAQDWHHSAQDNIPSQSLPIASQFEEGQLQMPTNFQMQQQVQMPSNIQMQQQWQMPPQMQMPANVQTQPQFDPQLQMPANIQMQPQFQTPFNVQMQQPVQMSGHRRGLYNEMQRSPQLNLDMVSSSSLQEMEQAQSKALDLQNQVNKELKQENTELKHENEELHVQLANATALTDALQTEVAETHGEAIKAASDLLNEQEKSKLDIQREQEKSKLEIKREQERSKLELKHQIIPLIQQERSDLQHVMSEVQAANRKVELARGIFHGLIPEAILHHSEQQSNQRDDLVENMGLSGHPPIPMEHSHQQKEVPM